MTRIADDGTEKPLVGHPIMAGGRQTAVTGNDGDFSGGFTVKQAGTVTVQPSAYRWFGTSPAHSFQVGKPLKASTFSSLKAGGGQVPEGHLHRQAGRHGGLVPRRDDGRDLHRALHGRPDLVEHRHLHRTVRRQLHPVPGLLQQSGTSWKAYGGQTVRVCFKASTSGATWKQLGTATTRDDGTFSKKFTAQQDGSWQIRYTDTPSTHYAVYGRKDFVDVR